MTTVIARDEAEQVLARAEQLLQEHREDEALARCLEAARAYEIPPAKLSLSAAKACLRLGDTLGACRWLANVVDAGDAFPAWQAAAALLDRIAPGARPTGRRHARVALLSSYTITQLVPLLKLAGLRQGIDLECYETDYGQYRQEILDPGSGLYAFAPDFVVLAVHAGDLSLPSFSDDPARDIETELARWTGLWQALEEHSRSRIVMHNFAIPPQAPFGHLGARVAGSRYAMIQQLNARLSEAAGADVALVDCDRISALVGKRQWFNDKYWHIAKQAVALGALPTLARHTVAVLAAELGLSRKCLVLDLDNTLWGGVIGDDGLAGLQLGNGPEGEAYVAFQEYLLELARRGVVLAVCSKNDDATAREPFLHHPDMRLRLDDIAVFVANWSSKVENLKTIANTLELGLDSLVLVDDNPAERQAVRELLPEVEVIPLPGDPAGYRAVLADCLWFEPATFTPDDRKRGQQYQARAAAAALRSGSTSLEDFHRGLGMRALIASFDELHLPRITQLINKTNQFNLTTKRYSLPVVRALAQDPQVVHRYVKLSDRFTDHGLVSVLIARQDNDVLEIDTWLMSCRVIGRTLEHTLFDHLCAVGRRLGCRVLRGTYIPTAKNSMVNRLYETLGFTLAGEYRGGTTWEYDLLALRPQARRCIEVEEQVTVS